jgi:hypothetical protein
MSYDTIQRRLTLVAAADYSAKQFYAMTLDTTAAGSQALLVSSAGVDIIGVLQDKPTLGQPGLICVDGVTKVLVGSAGFTAGDALQVDATGAFITATTGHAKVAKALETGASGDIAAVLLQRGPVNA